MNNLTKIHGAHVFKFGFYFQSASNASNNQTHVQSDLDFSNNASNPLNTGYGFRQHPAGRVQLLQSGKRKAVSELLYHDVSFYAQDTWKVNKHLTLDLGVRLSWYQPVTTPPGRSLLRSRGVRSDQGGSPLRPVCVGRLDLLVGRCHLPGHRPGRLGYPHARQHHARLLRGQNRQQRRQPHRRHGPGERGYPVAASIRRPFCRSRVSACI